MKERCYDPFWETCGMAGQMPVISLGGSATSTTDYGYLVSAGTGTRSRTLEQETWMWLRLHQI